MKAFVQRVLVAGGMLGMTACGGENTAPSGQVPGADQKAGTAALEAGAGLMQEKEPITQISMYLVGFHPSKADPQMQMESHHYCDQVNEDFAQCVLYDGNTGDARLHGIEYIDTASARKSRAGMAKLARPQTGVDALANAFPDAKEAPAGVKDSGDTAARGVPVMSMKRE